MKRLFALAACATLVACSSGSSNSSSSPTPTALVSLSTAESGAVASTQTIYGAVLQNADTQFTLSAPVEAIVNRVAASLGSAVSRGQLVVALAPSANTRANIATLNAQLQTAQQAYARAKRLRADGLASDADVQSARASQKTAQASLNAATTQSRELSLRAPGPGYIQSISVVPGQLVSAGTTIATINRVGALRARFGIDPTLISRLSRGAGLQLQQPGGGSTITIPIVAVDPSADPQTRLASIYVRVPEKFGTGAGQPLQGAITLQQAGNAVTVPYDALLNDGGQPYVFVVKNGVAHRHDVTVGASNGTVAAISQGVSSGDQVVTQGGTALEDGMKVRTK